MIYVIGSGPAGIACSVGLLSKGHTVTMLDAGLEIEPERQVILHQLESTAPKDWNPSAINSIKDNVSSGVSGIPLKYAYGSDFPYQETQKYIPFVANGVQTSPSLARGGFSNVWGSAVLPYRDSDMNDWPITAGDLNQHYKSVLSFMDFAGSHDDLEQFFPVNSDSDTALRSSNQSAAFLADMQKRRSELQENGIYFGKSRLAVSNNNDPERNGCAYCGLCMYGCPYNLIYNTSFTLKKLLSNPAFTYRRDIIVRRVEESGGNIRIKAESRLDNKQLEFDGSRAFLACGVLGTTKLLLESMNAYGKEVVIKDSQYFLMPLLRYARVAGVTGEALHTLSQIFMEIFDSAISDSTIHLQVYTYNDLYSRAMQSLLGPASAIFKLPMNEMISRMLVVQGYLHSDQSAGISAKLEEGKDGKSGKLLLDAKLNESTKRTMKAVVKKLSSNRRLLRALPLSPLLRIGEPGRGFHSGGSFPMTASPSEFQSDTLGRPHGFSRIHAVDSTVFPSIPATTITFSVMANAHRIATSWSEASLNQ